MLPEGQLGRVCSQGWRFWREDSHPPVPSMSKSHATHPSYPLCAVGLQCARGLARAQSTFTVSRRTYCTYYWGSSSHTLPCASVKQNRESQNFTVIIKSQLLWLQITGNQPCSSRKAPQWAQLTSQSALNGGVRVGVAVDQEVCIISRLTPLRLP